MIAIVSISLLIQFAAFGIIFLLCKHQKNVFGSRQEKEKHVIQVQAPSAQDLADAAQDAKNRHASQLPYFPKLELQPESITSANCATAKKRLQFKKHESTEPVFQPVRTSAKVTIADSCLVYVVFGNDCCRGELDKDENTLDLQGDASEKNADES